MSKLYVIPTPIGNLKDITQRALVLLSEVDFIIAEDTRVAAKLLKHFKISKPLMSFHKDNENKAVSNIIRNIFNKTAALISEAGMPGISDPGYLLVRECIKEGIEVETLPGATAFLPALINSGFPCNRFYFHGFLPHKKGRIKELEFIKSINVTAVLYESPHRLRRTLEQIADVFGKEHKLSVSREISKIFEETVRGNVSEITEYFSKKPVKGEFVITISPRQ